MSSYPATRGFVEVSALEKAFASQPVLCGIDLHVPKGSIAAVLGTSGSGKTTLLRLLAGFERPDAGFVNVAGKQVSGPGGHLAPRLRRIGYVPQEGNLFPHLDVSANIGFGVARSKRKARVSHLLGVTGLRELSRRFPHELSGGQQQRVALARALAIEPSLLLLDEPFSSLDALLRSQVRDEVIGIVRRTGTTAILVTHDQDEALSVSDIVAVLRDGVVAQCGTPQQLYTHPVDAELARFLGAVNLLPGLMDKGVAMTALGAIDLIPATPAIPDGSPLEVLIRPEQLILEPSSSPRTVASGVVLRCEYHGHDTLVSIEVETASPPRPIASRPIALQPIALRHPGAPTVRPGDRVHLTQRGEAVAWQSTNRRVA